MEVWDDYKHCDPKLIYIVENIKSADIEKMCNEEFCGCDCLDDCALMTCSCLQRSGGKYKFQEKLALEEYSLTITDINKPIYECNNNCNCKNKICGNKLVQFGPRHNLKVIETPQKGFGLTTNKPIESGKFICEYAGEVISTDEAHKRYTVYTQMGLENNYIFCVNENFGIRTERTYIDPTFYGNIGRYINHSCQPNSNLIPIRVNDRMPKLCIFAKENIVENDEITVSYGNCGKSSKKCLCLSPICKQYLPCENIV